MIVLAGLPDEGPIRLAAEALEALGAPFVVVDQRQHASIDVALVPAVAGEEPGGILRLPGSSIDLATVRGVYLRLHGAESIVELAALPEGAPPRARFVRLTSLLTAFADISPGVVFNRSPGMITNHSKAYQAQSIQAMGFIVPTTLITNQPEEALAFIEERWARGRAVVFKSVSSVRSIVRTVTGDDLKRLARLRYCPVQFQERVEGIDYRAHVIGEDVIATRIETSGTDYRYASREPDGFTSLHAATLPPAIDARCARLAASLDLGFAGVDLRRTPEDTWVCFEVNPSPAFSYYQAATGQPIAEALARRLARVG